MNCKNTFIEKIRQNRRENSPPRISSSTIESLLYSQKFTILNNDLYPCILLYIQILKLTNSHLFYLLTSYHLVESTRTRGIDTKGKQTTYLASDTESVTQLSLPRSKFTIQLGDRTRLNST
jgi:hypothetical protein